MKKHEHKKESIYLAVRVYCPFSDEEDGKHEVRIYAKTTPLGCYVFDHIETTCFEQVGKACYVFPQGCNFHRSSRLSSLGGPVLSFVNSLQAVKHQRVRKPSTRKDMRSHYKNLLTQRKQLTLDVIFGAPGSVSWLDCSPTHFSKDKLSYSAVKHALDNDSPISLHGRSHYAAGYKHDGPCVICWTNASYHYPTTFMHKKALARLKTRLSVLSTINFAGPVGDLAKVHTKLAHDTVTLLTRPQFRVFLAYHLERKCSSFAEYKEAYGIQPSSNYLAYALYERLCKEVDKDRIKQ